MDKVEIVEEKREVIKDSTYYYGVDILWFRTFPYEEVIYKKIVAAKALMKQLVRNDNMEDIYRMQKVHKAISDNHELLFELGYDLPTIVKKINEIEKDITNVN